MTFKTPLSPGCPACVVNEMPPFEPGDAYIAGSVEQERGEVLQFLCPVHKKMRKLFQEAAKLVERVAADLEAEPKKEERPS